MQAITQPGLGDALVAKSGATGAAPAEYLLLSAAGAMSWVRDPLAATPFPTMREATRMALRLPAGLRAYGLPRYLELALNEAH